jgi:orotidine-5'-phosphate decarboxylase
VIVHFTIRKEIKMSERNFRELLENQWSRGNFVCVGLDSDYNNIPSSVKDGKTNVADVIFAFNRAIVDATYDIVCAYKPQVAFYEATGDEGWRALQRTVFYIQTVAHDVPIILDAKRNDIGNTSEQYARAIFDWLGADAVTVNPYLGGEALQPFLDRENKGIIVLCRTSNPGAGEFQDLQVEVECEVAKRLDVSSAITYYMNGGIYKPTIPFWEYVAHSVAKSWNKNGNCALVVGANPNRSNELREVREIVGDMPILIPGIGAQGGDIGKTVSAGKDSRGKGFIVNSSRGIIFASKGADFAEVARRETNNLRDPINQYR